MILKMSQVPAVALFRQKERDSEGLKKLHELEEKVITVTVGSPTDIQ